MKAQDIVREALAELGAYSPFEQQDGASFDFGLGRLNALLDSWKAEKLTIPRLTDTTFSTVASTQSYTIGTGGTINITRPLYLESAATVISNQETPLRILDDSEWIRLIDKSLTSTPVALYLDRNFPLGNLKCWPVPDSVVSVKLYYAEALAEFTSLSDTANLPPGYREALYTNLALSIAPSFGKQPSDLTVYNAKTAKARIKGVNSRPERIPTEGYIDPRNHAYGWDADMWNRYLNGV